MRAEWVMKQREHAALDKFLVLRKLSLRQASAADLKFLHHPRQTRTGTSNRKAALAS
jgi:hypothetical protein